MMEKILRAIKLLITLGCKNYEKIKPTVIFDAAHYSGGIYFDHICL